ncbi:MAG: MFS transporter [Deltaproteobacteria bacterium HGW-Deltaproteobacteria-12]|jgi:sugar phosphate permease|nr:MAG: MFS transporter [Deltaproteobacteria bacterium HGW-Deltaproteobacteria-12]
MNIQSSPGYRWCIFAICAGMYIMSHFWRVSTAVIAGDLSRDLSLSPDMLGLLGGAFFYSFGLAQLPMGPLLDRFGSRAVISSLACVGAASAIFFAFSTGGSMAILARAGIGVGMAAVLMGSYKIFTTWFSPREFATLAGFLISIGNLGAIGATAPLVWLSKAIGWRGAFLCLAMITLLIAVILFLVLRDHPPRQASMPPQNATPGNDIFFGLRTVFGSGLFWRIAPLGFASYGALITAQGLWGGPYLMHTYGLSKEAAGGILLAVPIGAICGSPLWGSWSDILKRRKLPVLWGQGAMLLVFSSLTMDLHLPGWGLLLQFWLLGFTFSSNFIIYAQVKETFPLAIVGTALTAVNFFIMMGAASFQHVMGVIMNNWTPSITGVYPLASYQWGFGVSAALLCLAVLVYTSSRDTGVDMQGGR